MAKTMSVNQSKVKAWRACRQRYWYKYVEEIVPQKVKRPFTFGRIAHSMNEAHFSGEDPWAVLAEIEKRNRKLFREEVEMYGDLIADMTTIMKEYFRFWRDDDLEPIIIDGQACEHYFEIELEDGILFKGQIDLLARTPNKKKWLTEHKTFSNLPGEDERWRNIQPAVYIRAVEMMGWVKKLDGILWNYIRSKPPTIPKVLKTGGLSSREIITLPSVVLRTLKEHGISKKGHEKLLERARRSRADYFHRIPRPINRSLVTNLFDGFVDSAREIADNHGKKRDQNIGRHCGWCDYEPLCRAQLEGSDVDFVKEREFTHEDPEARYHLEKGVQKEEGKKNSRSKKSKARDSKRKRPRRSSRLRTVR